MGCCNDEKYEGADYGNPDYPGPETDDKLKEGPINDRSCTDILCCIIFIAYMVGFVYIAMIALSGPEEAGSFGMRKGRPDHMIALYDYDGYMCGLSGTNTKVTPNVAYDYSDYKYLYFWTPTVQYITRTTCVKKCPTVSDTTEVAKWYISGGTPPASQYQLECKTNSAVKQCYGVSDSTDMASMTLLTDYSGKFLVYETTPMYNRFCVPSSTSKSLANFYASVSSVIDSLDLVQNAISDVQTTFPLIIGSCFIALFCSFVWMMVMKCCAACITWTLICAVQMILVGITYYVYNKGVDKQKEFDEQMAQGIDPGHNYYEYGGYLCMVVTVAYFILICAFYTKIRIAIRIMETAADFVTECPLVVLVPPVTSILVVIWWCTWLIGFIHVWCMGIFSQADGNKMYGSMEQSYELKGVAVYFLFGGLWVAAFIGACNQFILGSSACIWYFSPRDPDDENNKIVEKAISRSVYRCFRYHLGSLAFGSFILALVQLARIILAYIQKQVQDAGIDKQSKIVAMLFAVVQCLLACFERIIKFINKNAYIQIAISSNCFCIACKDAFYLIFRNTFLFAIVAGIGEVFIWAGRIFITVFTLVIALVVMLNYDEYKNSVTYFYIPLFLIAIIAALIAVMFMSVWAMAADSILMCFCVDKELNAKGGGQPNTYCPKQLLEFVQEDYNKLAVQQAERKKEFRSKQFQKKREEDPNYGKTKTCCG